MRPLLSPVSGAPLEPEGEHLLRDADGRVWPVLDGIPYLRIGREALIEEAVAAIRAGDRDRALTILLADQDDWWTGPKPEPEALERLVRERDALSLREAMDQLGFDRVGHYFAHRWSDPTFLAGLGLLEAHWRPAKTAFELACGIGHFGRELAARGTA
ncbi:MAG: methyltransferase type 11, partial [Caulobacteraceae bacterium]|nr:methyltransferase type 11 [Caulobacter sp.]